MELSIDGGRTWEPVDKIEQVPDKKSGMYWSWALWEKHVPCLEPTSELVVRACKLFRCLISCALFYPVEALGEKGFTKHVYFCDGEMTTDDASGNVQPEEPIWNFRGVMNNAWSRCKNVVQTP